MELSTIEVTIERVEDSKLKDARIVKASSNEYTLYFDLIADLMDIKEGERVEVYIGKSKPKDIDSYEFCGHGYLIKPENEVDETLLSLWGIIFQFRPPIGLEYGEKYYLCMKKQKS